MGGMQSTNSAPRRLPGKLSHAGASIKNGNRWLLKLLQFLGPLFVTDIVQGINLCG